MSVARRIRTKHPLPNVLTLAGEKACTMCGQTRSLREFVRAAKLPGGIAGHCRLCQKRVNADWYQRNRARIAARLARSSGGIRTVASPASRICFKRAW